MRQDVVSAGLRCLALWRQGVNPRGFNSHSGERGGRNSSSQVLDWMCATRFFLRAFIGSWPSCVAQVVDRLGVLMARGAIHTVFIRPVHALVFMEASQLAKHYLLPWSANELALGFSGGECDRAFAGTRRPLLQVLSLVLRMVLWWMIGALVHVLRRRICHPPLSSLRCHGHPSAPTEPKLKFVSVHGTKAEICQRPWNQS